MNTIIALSSVLVALFLGGVIMIVYNLLSESRRHRKDEEDIEVWKKKYKTKGPNS
jgi:hypothetical protein